MDDKPPIAPSLWSAVSAFLFTLLALYAVAVVVHAQFFPNVRGRWTLGVVLAVSLAYSIRHGLRHWGEEVLHHRRQHRLCPGCGYDIRVTRHRCPECGRDLSPFQSNQRIDS